jgi:broad specificity phosphatase PhoE
MHAASNRVLMLVRHGESEANRAGTLDGYADAALTDLGRLQATQAAESLAALALERPRVISSPLRRALHTAEAIAAALGSELQLDKRLLAGEGRPGQGYDAAGNEMAAAIREAWSDAGGALIAVSHRFPIRSYLRILYGPSIAAELVDALGNGDALEVRFDADVAQPAVHRRLTASAR